MRTLGWKIIYFWVIFWLEKKKRIRHAFHGYKTCTKLIGSLHNEGDMADSENREIVINPYGSQ